MNRAGKLFVSDAVFDERLSITPQEALPAIGRWKRLSRLYKASFTACGLQIKLVTRPEIYRSKTAHRVLGVEPADLHLAVKPIDHLRPFHGLPNFFVCDWPYPELSDKSCGDSPFYNQTRLLGLAETVFCCTEFTAQTLRKNGVGRAMTLPPIIPVPSHRTDTVSQPSKNIRFLAVVDNCYQRQLAPIIDGFIQAARQNASLRLIICLQDGDEQSLFELNHLIAQSGAPSLATLDRVISVLCSTGSAAAISQTEVEFFLCGDPAPGLCIPLVEAMLAGLPVVTTLTAGTASFLPPEAVISIATMRQEAAADYEPISRFHTLTINPPAAVAVCDAVLAAAALDFESRASLAKRGCEIVKHQFSHAAFEKRLQRFAAFVAIRAS